MFLMTRWTVSDSQASKGSSSAYGPVILFELSGRSRSLLSRARNDNLKRSSGLKKISSRVPVSISGSWLQSDLPTNSEGAATSGDNGTLLVATGSRGAGAAAAVLLKAKSNC